MYSLMATLERAPEKISANASVKLEIDGFASSTETQVDRSTLAIASYNIHYAVVCDEEGECV